MLRNCFMIMSSLFHIRLGDNEGIGMGCSNTFDNLYEIVKLHMNFNLSVSFLSPSCVCSFHCSTDKGLGNTGIPGHPQSSLFRTRNLI